MGLFRSISHSCIVGCCLLANHGYAAHDNNHDFSWLGVRFADMAIDYEEDRPSGSGFGLVLDISDDFSLGLDYHNAGHTGSFVVRNTADTLDVADTSEETDGESGSLVLNYHPWGSSFYISGGVMYMGSAKVSSNTVLRTASNPTIELGDNGLLFGASTFSSLQGEITYADYAPYIGLGWNPFRTQSMISPYVNIGLVFNLRPDLAITHTGACSVNPTITGCTNLEQALREEADRREQDLDDYFWAASAGIIFRFF